jgi:transposase-like protein
MVETYRDRESVIHGWSSSKRCVMAFEPVHGPPCHGVAVVKYGKTSDGKQRVRCRKAQCECATFIRDDVYQGLLPEVKHKIVDISLNGSGIRAIARVFHISPSTVMHELKKSLNCTM